MDIDSPLLRQGELENLRIAAKLKLKRLMIEAKIAEMSSETAAIRSETASIRRETEKLRAGNAKLLSMLCEVVALKSIKADPLSAPTRRT